MISFLDLRFIFLSYSRGSVNQFFARFILSCFFSFLYMSHREEYERIIVARLVWKVIENRKRQNSSLHSSSAYVSSEKERERIFLESFQEFVSPALNNLHWISRSRCHALQFRPSGRDAQFPFFWNKWLACNRLLIFGYMRQPFWHLLTTRKNDEVVENFSIPRNRICLYFTLGVAIAIFDVYAKS